MHDLFANSFAEQNHEHQQKQYIQQLQLKLDDDKKSDEHTVDKLLPTTSTTTTPTETNNTLNLICVNETVCAEGNAFAIQFYPHSEYYDYVVDGGDFAPAAGQKNNKTHTSAATRSHPLFERQQSAHSLVHEFTGASLRRQQRTAYLKEDQWPI